MRSVLVSLACGALLLPGPVVHGDSTGVRSGHEPLAADQVSAAGLANETGKPVEILPDRTDYSQTFADPGGGLTLHEYPAPVFTRQADGSWARIDTNLTRRSDGLWAPGAITTGLTITGGGSGALYTLSQGGESLSVSWPYGPLPAPTVAGSTATYPNVLPGVNLLVSATPTGVSDVIEVTSALAAANPHLAQIRFGVRASGLALSASASGGVSAANSSGKAVFSAPPAQMWDSSGPAAEAGKASEPRRLLPGDHAAVMKLTAAAGSLQLSPAVSVLAGSSTVYPVWIDPTIGTVSPDSWLDVTKNCQNGTCSVPAGDWEPTATCPNGANCGIREGASCLPDNNGSCPTGTLYTVVRSYLNFAVPSQIWGAQYVHATLFTNETWVWSCQETTTVNLYQTNTADKGIDWNHQPTQLGLQDTSKAAYGNSAFGCNPHGVSFDASPALADAARNKLGTVTLELRAPGADESGLNVNSWHRFSTSSKETYLTIDYRHAPDQATSPLTRGVFDAATDGTRTGCSQSATSPDWINTTTPTLQAGFDDPDGGNGGPVSGEFSLAYSVPGGGGGDSGQSGRDLVSCDRLGCPAGHAELVGTVWRSD
jgi:hypothetical protein